RAGLVQVGDLAGQAVAQAAVPGTDHHLAERGQAASQLGADLAVAAEQEQAHARAQPANSGSRSRGRSASSGSFASLSDSNGREIGQSIASSGSSQRMPASASGA